MSERITSSTDVTGGRGELIRRARTRAADERSEEQA